MTVSLKSCHWPAAGSRRVSQALAPHPEATVISWGFSICKRSKLPAALRSRPKPEAMQLASEPLEVSSYKKLTLHITVEEVLEGGTAARQTLSSVDVSISKWLEVRTILYTPQRFASSGRCTVAASAPEGQMAIVSKLLFG